MVKMHKIILECSFLIEVNVMSVEPIGSLIIIPSEDCFGKLKLNGGNY